MQIPLAETYLEEQRARLSFVVVIKLMVQIFEHLLCERTHRIFHVHHLVAARRRPTVSLTELGPECYGANRLSEGVRARVCVRERERERRRFALARAYARRGTALGFTFMEAWFCL